MLAASEPRGGGRSHARLVSASHQARSVDDLLTARGWPIRAGPPPVAPAASCAAGPDPAALCLASIPRRQTGSATSCRGRRTGDGPHPDSVIGLGPAAELMVPGAAGTGPGAEDILRLDKSDSPDPSADRCYAWHDNG